MKNDIVALAARVQALEDERAVLSRIYRYAHTTDYGPVEAWVDCFTDDGVLVHRSRTGRSMGRFEGRAALTDFKAQDMKPPFKYRKHLIIEPVIRMNGAEATVVSYYAALRERDGAPHLSSFGRYLDLLAKCPDGQWRFAEKVIDQEAAG